MSNLKKWNYIISTIFIAIGLFVIRESLKLGIDLNTDGDPGAGFWSLMIGSLIILCSIILAYSNLKNNSKNKNIDFGFIKNKLVYKIEIIVIGYLILIKLTGFYIATVLFIVSIMKTLGTENKKTLLITSLGSVAFIYIIFGLILRISFPKPFFIG